MTNYFERVGETIESLQQPNERGATLLDSDLIVPFIQTISEIHHPQEEVVKTVEVEVGGVPFFLAIQVNPNPDTLEATISFLPTDPQQRNSLTEVLDPEANDTYLWVKPGVVASRVIKLVEDPDQNYDLLLVGHSDTRTEYRGHPYFFGTKLFYLSQILTAYAIQWFKDSIQEKRVAIQVVDASGGWTSRQMEMNHLMPEAGTTPSGLKKFQTQLTGQS